MENTASESRNGESLDQVGAEKSMQDDANLNQESPDEKSFSFVDNQLDDEIEPTKMELHEMIEENQRLKKYLNKIVKAYTTLQARYKNMNEGEGNKPRQSFEETEELVALSLGRTTSFDKTNRGIHTISKDEEGGGRLSLGLDCKFETSKKKSPNASPENSFEEVKDDESKNGGDDEIVPKNPTKRARVSVRVRIDTPTMNDGCQWRKYGQKVSKGNPCPRAYYRCTMASSCPVRKQVQRSVDDMSILITTYEGTHNHPLPMSATPMASTTSAAASMLISGSSTSGSGSMPTTGTLSGLNFHLSDTSKSKPFYQLNSTLSSSPTCPAVTLDLTSTYSSSSSSTQTRNAYPQGYAAANLKFGSLESSAIPMTLNNEVSSHVTSRQPINNLLYSNSNSISFGAQPQEQLYPAILPKTMQNPRQQHTLWADNIAAATKGITSDRSFQSALAAALSSIINSCGGVGSLGSQISNVAKTSEPFPILSTSTPSNKCVPGFMIGSAPQSGLNKVILHPPPFPFSGSKRRSDSPHDTKDHHV